MKLYFHSIKMYACEYCTTPFIQKSYLLRHKREVHEWILRFECEKCEKKFRESQILRDINVPAVFAIGVTSNSRPPQEKKSHVCEPAMKKA